MHCNVFFQVAAAPSGNEALYAKVAAQGDVVRKLKSEKADKATVGEAVKVCYHLYSLSIVFLSIFPLIFFTSLFRCFYN